MGGPLLVMTKRSALPGERREPLRTTTGGLDAYAGLLRPLSMEGVAQTVPSGSFNRI
jgi:hypothetical protein